MGPHALSPTHYEVLGVSETASVEEVRRRRRVLARRYHPDVAQRPDPRRLARILEACDVLGDPARRRDYDAWLDAQRTYAPPSVLVESRPWSSPSRFPWSTLWIQVLVYGVAAATLPGYVTAYWIGSDLSPASAQSSPHMLLLDTPVLLTLAAQAVIVVSIVVAAHTLRYRRATRAPRRVTRSFG
jgi:hypothetical protein